MCLDKTGNNNAYNPVSKATFEAPALLKTVALYSTLLLLCPILSVKTEMGKNPSSFGISTLGFVPSERF